MGDGKMEEKKVSMLVRNMPEDLRKRLKIRAAIKEISMQDMIIDILTKNMEDK
jgi:plasmid stability protein